jgi:hypothetical protein
MKSSKNAPIDSQVINQAMSYDEYRKLIDKLLSEGKTTGPKQSEGMTEYTRKNVKRMRRLDEETELKASLKEKLQDVDKPLSWLVVTEGWCGDAAQNIPVLNKMAEASSYIELKLILRDQHLDIMDQYLTNGGRSIPKFVCLDGDSLEELGTWGPRPGNFQQKAMAWKDDPDLSMEEWAEKLHQWYAEDQTETIQSDFETLIKEWQ